MKQGFVRQNKLILGAKIVGDEKAAEFAAIRAGSRRRTGVLGTMFTKDTTDLGAAAQRRLEAAEEAAADGEQTAATLEAGASISIEKLPSFLQASPHLAADLARAELVRIPRPRMGALEIFQDFLDETEHAEIRDAIARMLEN